MSLETQIAGVVAQSKRIDGNIEALVVRLAQDKAIDQERGRYYSPDDEEQDALVALALTTVRQVLDEHRLIITMLQEIMWAACPERLTRP